MDTKMTEKWRILADTSTWISLELAGALLLFTDGHMDTTSGITSNFVGPIFPLFTKPLKRCLCIPILLHDYDTLATATCSQIPILLKNGPGQEEKIVALIALNHPYWHSLICSSDWNTGFFVQISCNEVISSHAYNLGYIQAALNNLCPTQSYTDHYWGLRSKESLGAIYFNRDKSLSKTDWR